MTSTRWQPVTADQHESTDRLAVEGGWLYGTEVLLTRPAGERVAIVATSDALCFVPRVTSEGGYDLLNAPGRAEVGAEGRP